jgi:hypothetical protein
VDPGGQYYFIEVAPNVTSVARTRDPEVLLTKSDFRGETLFVQRDVVCLCGRDFNYYGKYFVHKEALCHVFKVSGQQLSLEREVRIARPRAGASPFNVEDMDLESGDVLLADTRDPPGRGWFLLFSMESGKLINIGPITAFGFFLKGDILRGSD